MKASPNYSVSNLYNEGRTVLVAFRPVCKVNEWLVLVALYSVHNDRKARGVMSPAILLIRSARLKQDSPIADWFSN